MIHFGYNLLVCACTWMHMHSRLRVSVHINAVHAPTCACVRMCTLGSFDASLSALAQFALFVFNDASREADSRRVERTAFDVSDYDITDVQPRRAEEWGSVLSVFFFHFPVAYYSEKKREGEIETHTQREEERLNIWPKPECDFVFSQTVLTIDVFRLCCDCLTQTRIYRDKITFLSILSLHL